MPSPGTVHAAGKRVGFLELFFDLVFVFAVTQLVGLLHDDHTALGWLRAGLVLWLVWWAWSQYAWAGNAIDLDHRPTKVAVLAVTGAMLLAAAALPMAFSDDGAWFAIPYVAVRLAGLALYWHGLRDEPAHRAALVTYLPIALIGPLIVLAGGIVGGTAQVWLWIVAIVIDVASVIAAGRGEFQVDPAHFAERHGLIVIIALGEAVVATGATAAQVGIDRPEAALLSAGFLAVGGLWWCYFDWMHPEAEALLVREPDPRRRGHLARDLFTLAHLPIVGGIVVFAAGIEEALLAPADTLDTFGTIALAAGIGLYQGGSVIGNLRATGTVLTSRLVGLVVTAAWILLAGPRVAALVTVTVLALVTATIAAVEVRARTRSRVAPTP